jgi:hypothetical protein
MVDKRYSSERPRINAELERDVKTRAGHRCEVKNCNEHTYLEMHHIDQNRENNKMENLILLCRKHHAMAHADKIDRKSLKIYISGSASFSVPVNTLDMRAYKIISQEFMKGNLFNNLRSNEFTGLLSNEFIDSIHDVIHIWNDPFSSFSDPTLNDISLRLKDACWILSRAISKETYRGRDGGDHFEIPKEYDEDRYYNVVSVLTAAAKSVCDEYTRLLRAAAVAGIDC